jgi:hypothetical protein
MPWMIFQKADRWQIPITNVEGESQIPSETDLENKKGLSDSKQSAGLFFSGRGLSGTRQCGKLVSQASCVSLVRTPLLSQGTGWASGSHSEPASLSQDVKSKMHAKTQKQKHFFREHGLEFVANPFRKTTCVYKNEIALCPGDMRDK